MSTASKRLDYEVRLETLRVRLDRAANRNKDGDQKKLLATAMFDAAKAVNAKISDDRKAAILNAGLILLSADTLFWRQWPTAYDEAGHAVAAIHLGNRCGSQGFKHHRRFERESGRNGPHPQGVRGTARCWDIRPHEVRGGETCGSNLCRRSCAAKIQAVQCA